MFDIVDEQVYNNRKLVIYDLVTYEYIVGYGIWRSSMFLCREKELGILSRRYNGSDPECVIIYGRRRVGKTALINEFTRSRKCIYFPALDSTAQDNLTALSKSIQSYLNPARKEYPLYNSFDAAFDEITDIAKKERIIVAIDEFPYLAKAERSIPSRLQHLIDHDWQKTGIFLILCGSSISFMEKEVLGEKSPLFGRRTCQLKIEPLDYLETAKFNPGLKPEDNALIYAVTGGVPHYINKLNVHGDLKTALVENLFDTSSYLFEEPGNLLKQELREPAVYNSIITAVAAGRTRLADIAGAVHLETSACSGYLNSLQKLGIVTRTEPVVDRSKRKIQYRVADQFFRFWYRFVPANMMSISSGKISKIYDKAIGSYLDQYMGLTFEEISKQFLLKYDDDLDFPIADIGEWWGAHPEKHKEVQLDIVAVAPKENNTSNGTSYLIGSCKYTNDKVGLKELELIGDYASVFTSAEDTCRYCLFSKSGFTDDLKSLAKDGQVRLYNLADMYY